MFKINYAIISVSICLICGCKNDPHRIICQKIDVVQCLKSENKINLSQYCDSIDYIQLETRDSSIFGRADHYAISDTHILILDSDLGKILLFDREGKFKRVFMRKGKGPLEFIQINNIEFAKNGDAIIFKNGKTIEIFSMDGVLKNEFELKNFASKVALLGDDKIAVLYPFPYYISNDGYGLETYTLAGVLEKRMLKHDKEKFVRGSAAAWKSINYIRDTVSYWDAFSDTIVGITHNLKLHFRWLVDKRQGGVNNNSIKDGSFMNELSTKFIIDSWLENEQIVIFSGVQNRYCYGVVYDKLKRQGSKVFYNYDINDLGFHNDIDGGFPIWPSSMLRNGAMVSIIEANDFKYITTTSYNKSVVAKKESAKLKTILKSIKFNDNPIIMIAYEKSYN